MGLSSASGKAANVSCPLRLKPPLGLHDESLLYDDFKALGDALAGLTALANMARTKGALKDKSASAPVEAPAEVSEPPVTPVKKSSKRRRSDADPSTPRAADEDQNGGQVGAAPTAVIATVGGAYGTEEDVVVTSNWLQQLFPALVAESAARSRRAERVSSGDRAGPSRSNAADVSIGEESSPEKRPRGLTKSGLKSRRKFAR